MPCGPRRDDFASRRAALRDLSDEELGARFWDLVEEIVTPLIEEARTHTTVSIERSVLLRMGFSSAEAKDLAAKIDAAGLLGEGAGRLVLELASRRKSSVREVGLALLDDQLWDELQP